MERARLLREQRLAGKGSEDPEERWNDFDPATPISPKPTTPPPPPPPVTPPHHGFSDALDNHLQTTSMPGPREEYQFPDSTTSPGNDALTQHMALDSTCRSGSSSHSHYRTSSPDHYNSQPQQDHHHPHALEHASESFHNTRDSPPHGRRGGGGKQRAEWNCDVAEDPAEVAREGSGREEAERRGAPAAANPSRVGQRGKLTSGASRHAQPEWNSDGNIPSSLDPQEPTGDFNPVTPPSDRSGVGRRTARPDWDVEMVESPLDKAPPPASKQASSKGGFLTLLKKRISRAPTSSTSQGLTDATPPPGRPARAAPKPVNPEHLSSYPLESVQRVQAHTNINNGSRYGANGDHNQRDYVQSGTENVDDVAVGQRGEVVGGKGGGMGNMHENDPGNVAASLSGCPSCGRTFNARALGIHVKSCQKPKRAAFDSASMRQVEDSQAPAPAARAAAPVVKKKAPVRPAPKARPPSSRAEMPKTEEPAPRGPPNRPPPPPAFGGGGGMAVEDMPAKASGGRGGFTDPFGQGAMPDEYAPVDQALRECGGCGRSFNPKAYAVHQKVCKKVFQTKRQAFDVAAARAPDVPDAMQFLAKAKEEEKYELKKATQALKKKAPTGRAVKADNRSATSAGQANKPAWKAQSEAFRAQMRAANQYTSAVAQGKNLKDLPPPPPAAIDPSFKPCPHCGRSFSEKAAERHIPKCNDIRAKPTMLKRGAGVGAHVRAGAGGASFTPPPPPPTKPVAKPLSGVRRAPAPVSAARRK